MFPTLSIGPLVLPVPALLLILGVYFGLTAVEKLAPREKVASAAAINSLMMGLLVGLIAARVAFVFRFPDSFQNSPWQVLLPRPDLMDLQSGFVAGLAATMIYVSRKPGTVWSFLDAFTPGLALFSAAWWAANFASGRLFGTETTLPWGISLWGAVRHPSQLYGFLGAIIVVLIVLPDWKKIVFQPAGMRFLVFLSITAGVFLKVSKFRGDVPTIGVNIHTDQLFAWLILAAVLFLIGRRIQHNSGKEAEYREGI